MNEKQKNKSMVNAFGTGKPPVATVRRRGETKQQQRARGQGVDPNSDINAIFSGMQQMRTRVHKGMSGMPLNPDGTDPGNSFDRFMKQNPHLQGAAQRQAQYDQQAKNNLQANLQSAVAERKALQEMQNQNPNLVTGADGYRTLFDGQGKVIGTTKPLQSKAMWSQDDAINRGTASPDERRDFANTLQNTGMSSVASEIQGPKLPANMSTLFPGKSSPPGGGQGDRVGSSNPSGEPGGETMFGQMPNVQGEGMPMGVPKARTARQPGIQYGPRQPVQQTGWDTLFPGKQVNSQMEPNSGPQRNAMGPNEGPQRPADFGLQLPYSSGEQLMALKRLYGFGGNNNPTLTALEGTWSNIFPGVKDYDYLRQLFPGLVHPQAGSGQLMSSLAKMYQNPAYQALFPNVNQSEFYR